MQAQLCGCLPMADDMPDQHSMDFSAVFTPQIRDDIPGVGDDRAGAGSFSPTPSIFLKKTPRVW
eukprot:COSAG02_NODE_68675_length_230_cov_48.793893_1_plen_63_part_10